MLLFILCKYDSFYQYKNNVGQGCCVEVCDLNNQKQSICDTKINERFRHQFVGKFLIF